MADPLSLSTYAIKREMKFGGLTLDFMDGEGNQVLKSEGRMAVTQQPIASMDGTILATITHKLLAMTPEYDIHEGGKDGKVLSVLKVPMQLLSSMTLGDVDIKDEGGNLIAKANGNFLGMEFEIRDAKGTSVASVTRNLGTNPGLLSKFAAFASNSYVMNIKDDKTVSTLVLLGFLVVLELLISKGQASNPGLIGGGVGGFGGMGSGGFGIKL
jgi:uncharacterized protein YxjI